MLAGLLLWLGKRRPAPAITGSAIPLEPFTSREFTIGIYNIHRARGTDGGKDLSRIAEVIADTDVVGLCECEGASIRGGRDQCVELGASLNRTSLSPTSSGRAAIFSPTQHRWGRYDRGNGLLSRIPVSSWAQVPLVDSTGTHPRCLLQADLDVDGINIPVFVTHLARRIDQANQLQTVIDRFSQYDCAILLGDLNLTRDYPPLADLIAAKENQDAITAAGIDDPDRIDWVITRGCRVLAGGCHPVGPSDHPYYWVRIEI